MASDKVKFAVSMTPLEMVGVNDRFGESGNTSELMSHLNIDFNAIISASHAAIKRK